MTNTNNTMTMNTADVYSEHGVFLTVTDLTEILKVSRFVVDRMLRNGQLPAAKLGGQCRVRTDDFLKWWDNQVKQEQKNLMKKRLMKNLPRTAKRYIPMVTSAMKSPISAIR